MSLQVMAAFPAFVLHPTRLLPVGPSLPLSALSSQLTPVVKITALLACTPVSGAPVVITAPGRYRLTRDLAVTAGTAITICADHVTLDLDGFILTSSARPAAGAAIAIIGPRRHVTIRHGAIRNPSGPVPAGFRFGVSGGNPGASQITVRDLEITGPNVAAIALSPTGSGTLVERCRVRECAGLGILAQTVRDCVVESPAARRPSLLAA